MPDSAVTADTPDIIFMSVSRVLRASRALRAHVSCKRLVFYIVLLKSANVIPKLVVPLARPLVQWQNNQLADCGN